MEEDFKMAANSKVNFLKEAEYLHEAAIATSAVYMAVKDKGYTPCDMSELCFALLGDYKVTEKQKVLDIVKDCPEQLIVNLKLVLSRNCYIEANHPDFKNLDYNSCFSAHDGDPSVELDHLQRYVKECK
jgi:hypothetical protein